MSEFACHPCTIFHGWGHQVFVKYAEGPEGYAQFENELSILRFLNESAEVAIPQTGRNCQDREWPPSYF